MRVERKLDEFMNKKDIKQTNAKNETYNRSLRDRKESDIDESESFANFYRLGTRNNLTLPLQ